MIESHKALEGRLTIHTVTGPIQARELEAAAIRYVRDMPTPLCLWDFTGADFSLVRTDDLRGIFDGVRPWAENRRGGRTALLFSSHVGFGMGRMSEAIAETREYPYQFRSFWEREVAMCWLTSEAGDKERKKEGTGAA